MFSIFAKKPAVPMISQAEHVRIVAEKVGEARTGLIAEAQQERETAGRLLGKNVALRSEVAELRAELATFRQQQEQRRANLAKGTVASAAKRAAAKAERAGSVG